jgi:hypothetical protein
VTKDGSDRISQHGDQQTVGPYNFTQATDAKKPLYVADQLDGYPSIRLDGIDDHLINTAIAPVLGGTNKPFSMFWVARRISVTGYVWWAISQGASSRPIIELMDYFGDYTFRRLDGGVSVGGGVPDANWHYYILTFSGTNVTIRVDGLEVANQAATDIPASMESCTDMAIAARMYSGADMGHQNIEYTDWAAYNLAISAPNIALLENYAHTRYPSI